MSKDPEIYMKNLLTIKSDIFEQWYKPSQNRLSPRE